MTTSQATDPKPTAIQFGAGNIGRGFIGALLAHSGYRVVFADINEAVISALRDQGRYTVQVLDVERRSEEVTGVTGILSNGPEIVPAVAQASLITTAVGPNVLKIIAPTLARGIEERARAGAGDLNIIACENMVGASSFLKEQVESHLSEEGRRYADEHVGFPNSSVDRIVPPFSSENPLDVGVEAFYEWIVERPAFKGPVPDIEGMKLTDNLVAYVQRKLFTLNNGHAVAAYLGVRRGLDTIEASMNDPEIAAEVRAAMEQSGAALVRRYGFDPAEHAAYIDKIMGRFRNPHIRDEVLRVGREPLRKLGAADRIVGPARMAAEYGLPTDALQRGAAAALRYDNPADPQAAQLQAMIGERGIEAAVTEATGLEAGSDLHRGIVEAYRALGD
ncbi:mannitol-1-phosphate 5-dehydrogenase [Deinococcus gobiensis]|uniref:Mannitol-1-phosphate 5-dehydrogenase n=1 Tax=Deinococcus gobiensis (strain DSM 21396 / JCM 16679 / CGMCC 1.7299 / I-0) TaxID=745776 RepID=H8GTA3_DEIGI|nr:mannitol-1-phosphate 5-dehydrogenase [Deinococcus gobiensis]AFD26555.1 Mannitol dehydrogenase [Deinococcus gobiensis I-0]